MTGDGHSKDARMLTEVTTLVNTSGNVGACSSLTNSVPLYLDRVTARRYARAGHNGGTACDTLQTEIQLDI